MRGQDAQQGHMWSYIQPEQRVPQDHPLRAIRAMVDQALQDLSPRFALLYSHTGRPSIPPEQLLRALLLPNAEPTVLSPEEDPGNPTVDFRGEKRSNATHQSTTDPDAQLVRKSRGQAAISRTGGTSSWRTATASWSRPWPPRWSARPSPPPPSGWPPRSRGITGPPSGAIIRVPLADGQLVDADDLRPRRAHAAQLFGHVLLVQGLDRLPVQVGLPGDSLDAHPPAPPPDPEGEPLDVEQRVGQPVQLLLLHLPAAPTADAAHFHVQVDAPIPAGEVPHSAHLPIVESAMHTPADPTGRFFPRRRSRMTRAYGSPKTPLTTDSGSWPGYRYVSHKRLAVRMQTAYYFSGHLESRLCQTDQRVACS